MTPVTRLHPRPLPLVGDRLVCRIGYETAEVEVRAIVSDGNALVRLPTGETAFVPPAAFIRATRTPASRAPARIGTHQPTGAA